MYSPNNSQCMIYKHSKNTGEETKYYNKRIKEFAEYLSMENNKGKFPLIITGSGISEQVPTMSEMMDKLNKLILSISNEGITQYSNTFQKIFNEYKETIEASVKNEEELHTQQSRLLTYIQNVYISKRNMQKLLFIH